MGVYLGVRTCELFLCFVAIVRVYYVDFLVFSLFYVTGEFHRFLHRGRALFEISVLHSHYLNKRTYNFQPHNKVHKLYKILTIKQLKSQSFLKLVESEYKGQVAIQNYQLLNCYYLSLPHSIYTMKIMHTHTKKAIRILKFGYNFPNTIVVVSYNRITI